MGSPSDRPLTAAILIEYLQELPPDTPVLIQDPTRLRDAERVTIVTPEEIGRSGKGLVAVVGTLPPNG